MLLTPLCVFFLSICWPILLLFFFNDTATTEIYTLFPTRRSSDLRGRGRGRQGRGERAARARGERERIRSEEHTSELQSQSNLVCRLLLEKKKVMNNANHSLYHLAHGLDSVERVVLGTPLRRCADS